MMKTLNSNFLEWEDTLTSWLRVFHLIIFNLNVSSSNVCSINFEQPYNDQSVPRAMFTHFVVEYALSQYYLYWIDLPGVWITYPAALLFAQEVYFW